MGSGDTTVDMSDWDPNADSETDGQPDHHSTAGALVPAIDPQSIPPPLGDPTSDDPPPDDPQTSPPPRAKSSSSPPPPTGQRLSDRAGGALKRRPGATGSATSGSITATPIIADRGIRTSQWAILAVLAIGGFVLAGLLIALLTRFSLFGGTDDSSTGEAATSSTGTSEDRQQPGPAAPAVPTGQSGALESLRCPVLTDSVDRLFLALLDRFPTEAEFARAVRQYRTGEQSLQGIAQSLTESDALRELEDEAFVDRIYDNTRIRRVPENRDVWIAALQSGQPRGMFVVAISESQEFVEATRTATPMSGFLRTYPVGTHWYCGVGSRDDLPIKPLVETAVYADYMFHNAGRSDSQTGIQTVIDSQSYLPITAGSLPPGATNYRWNGLFDGDGDYGTALDIDAGTDTWWAVVFYPESIGEGRLGWQISS